MSEVYSRQTLISLVPRQVMLETATKAAAISEDNRKKQKMNDKGVSLVNVNDDVKKSKKKKKSCKISDVSVDLCVAEGTLGQDRPNDDGVSRNGMGREDLLRSIAAFLDGSGFFKTLSVFLLEAKIDVKGRGDSCINLENLFDKVIESSRKDEIPSIEWPKEQDLVDDSNVKAKDKKRKDKASSHSIEERNVVKHYVDTSLGTAECIDFDCSLIAEKKKRRKLIHSENKGEQVNIEEVKEKIEEFKELTSKCSFETVQAEKNKREKKKKKDPNQSLMLSEMGVSQEFIVEKPCDGENYDSGSHRESVILGGYNKGGKVCLNFEEVMEEKSSNPFEKDDIMKTKAEKKKKKNDPKKVELGGCSDVVLEKSSGGDFGFTKLQESLNSENKVKDVLNVECSKKKKKADKTKKIEKLSSDNLSTTNSCMLVVNKLDGLGKNDNDVLGNSDFRNKNILISEKNNGDVEKSTNKKRKRSLSNETTILVENINAAKKSKLTKSDFSKDKKEIEDPEAFTCCEPAPVHAESKESSEARSSIVLDEHEKNHINTEKQMNGHQLENGDVEKHENEGSARTKSIKKEKLSGKPKVGNSFQRIKVDEVKYAHDRLRDSSYWSMDASGTGYGAKAQEVLGRVKGRDFRHEKTKKKRGTYRGGQIDIEAKSFKFKDSDDE